MAVEVLVKAHDQNRHHSVIFLVYRVISLVVVDVILDDSHLKVVHQLKVEFVVVLIVQLVVDAGLS